MQHPYEFEDGEQIYFAPGRFDDWCVYRVPPEGRARAPRDTDYFAELERLGNRYGRERIYSYFQALYVMTGKEPTADGIELIQQQSRTLDEGDSLAYSKTMMILYYAMIAEENREPAYRFPLKKRVKKIGVFQVLIEEMPPQAAANFSRGQSARDLKKLLDEYEQRETEIFSFGLPV